LSGKDRVTSVRYYTIDGRLAKGDMRMTRLAGKMLIQRTNFASGKKVDMKVMNRW
jgi:hypothetical protein